MSKYRRITLAARCQIDAKLQAGFSVPEISKSLGYHKSTIYRELRRNAILGSYRPSSADSLSKKRYRSCRKLYKVNPSVASKLQVYLEFGWSPDQISKRLLRESCFKISHECIYQYIYSNSSLRKYLRRPKKRGFSRYSQTRCLAKNGRPLRDRPAIANRRGRIGDWERDLFYGANRQQVLVCTDRKSRYTKISKLKRADSTTVGEQTELLINSLSRRAYSVTNDNGTEFRGKRIAIKTFYCEPRKPQQRGTIENTIGLIRQYISRKTDLSQITEEQIREIENKLNFRPRKCLDYKTPHEVFFNKSVALAN